MNPLKQINVGAAPDDGQGDLARDAFIKVNDNATAIQNAVGTVEGGVQANTTAIQGLTPRMDAAEASLQVLGGTVANNTASINGIRTELTTTTATANAALNAAFQTLRGQVFGPGQTLQDMTASRAFRTNYVNSTGKPIFVFVYSESTTAQGYNSIFVNSQIVSMGTFPAAQASNVSQAMVPPGATYMATGASTTLRKWQEYR